MPSIVTLTFSPCIDKSTTIPELIAEKKLRCARPKLEPGGGGINVARAIKKLGGEAIAVYPAGGYTGKFFNHLLQQDQVASIVIETKNETRENIIVREESTNRQYRFGMPGEELTTDEWQRCIDVIGEIKDLSFIVASGSLPPGVPVDVYVQLAKLAKIKNAKLIVDTSGEALKQVAREGVYLLKPNLGELSSLVDKEMIAPEMAAGMARILITQGKAEVIVVSMGAAGAILVTKDAEYKVTPPAVLKKSTVGAGDSMVAGIVHALSAQKSLEEALRYGVACGTAATLNEGTELCRKEDADKLYVLMLNNQ
jgi:6-phosphofructokinase 2